MIHLTFYITAGKGVQGQSDLRMSSPQCLSDAQPAGFQSFCQLLTVVPVVSEQMSLAPEDIDAGPSRPPNLGGLCHLFSQTTVYSTTHLSSPGHSSFNQVKHCVSLCSWMNPWAGATITNIRRHDVCPASHLLEGLVSCEEREKTVRLPKTVVDHCSIANLQRGLAS